MNAPLNCKQGDRAVVIKAPPYNPWMLGLVVECLALEDPPEVRAVYAGRVWRIGHRLVWKESRIFTGHHIPDAFLRAVGAATVLPPPSRPKRKPVPPDSVRLVPTNREDAFIVEGDMDDAALIELVQTAAGREWPPIAERPG